MTEQITRRGLLQAGGAVAFTALLGSACSSSNGQQAGSSSTVLTIGQQFAANNLDPVKANGAVQMYIWPAYDPLIYLAPDGSLHPRLAASWRYLGSGNEQFELRLRPKVKFSDGSPLTAAVVKANIEYAKKAGAEVSPRLASIKSINAVDDLTLRLTMSAPTPELPYLFTQKFQSGSMISGKALNRPAALATKTFGAGPYLLDPAGTVANDHYTYTRNPHYWDKASVHYQKLVIKVLPNPNTGLSALKTGQVDALSGDPTTVKAAKQAGLDITFAPVSFWGLAFADRAGDIVPALGDVRVRQAINYALDREKITRALLGKYGSPAEQIVAPGMDGFNDTTFYNHDPAKARRLLADAGYANGFELPTLSISLLNLMAQAIADQLKEVGIRLKITNRSDAPAYTQDLSSGKYPAFAIGYGMDRIALMGSQLFLPAGALFNPRKSSDAKITGWYNQALAADKSTRAELDKKVVARLAEQAWFAPVAYSSQLVYSRSTVSGVQVTAQRAFPYPLEWKPAQP